WPIGSAENFRGVYDIPRSHLLLYEREAQGQFRAPVDISSLDDPAARDLIGENVYAHFRENLDVIGGAGTPYDAAAYRAGGQTPVFFGSALTNFGLEPFLRALVELAPSPQPRSSHEGTVVPTEERFTGFVFKIQANMDPRHRDRASLLGAVHERHGGPEQPGGQTDSRVPRVSVFRPRARNDQRRVCRRH